jgi:hypothetical protein
MVAGNVSEASAAASPPVKVAGNGTVAGAFEETSGGLDSTLLAAANNVS